MSRPDLSSPRALAILAGGASAAMLAAALFFQAVGFAPCELCILQRWPHLAAALVAAAVALTGFRRIWGLLGLIAAVVATVLAGYHAGVEQGWWAGPVACSGGLGDLSALSPQDLLARIQAAPVVRCDQPEWFFLGLTMAAWNTILSAALVVVWTLSLRRPAR